MLLRQDKKRNANHIYIKSKSLSDNLRALSPFFPQRQRCAKVLQCVLQKGSFTVEAAFVLPLFLFAALAVLGLFPLLLLQTQVNNGLQYTARIMAVSYRDAMEEKSILSIAEGEVLFRHYMKEHGCDEDALARGMNSISLLRSEVSGDYVTLVADYDVQLPISFWSISSLPVEQCVRVKKWTGADSKTVDAEDSYVYITPSGNAYHSTPECSYLRLSVQSASVSALNTLRNKDGSIYYPCSCYNGESRVYITDYGTEYHGNLSCSSLKRTIYKVTKEQIGSRHPCTKCFSN